VRSRRSAKASAPALLFLARFVANPIFDRLMWRVSQSFG
jgi:hypothetical protein